jgi:hypothetical protein
VKETSGVHVRPNKRRKTERKRRLKKRCTIEQEPATIVDKREQLEQNLFGGDENDIYIEDEEKPTEQVQNREDSDFSFSDEDQMGEFIVDERGRPVKRARSKKKENRIRSNSRTNGKSGNAFWSRGYT